MLYLESPVGVGFTYSNNNNFYNNDTRSAEMNFDALQSFFTSYPEYKTNPFYIMGESYAGIYVPTLAQRVLQSPNFVGPPLLGVAVGNGCTGTSSKSTCAVGAYCEGPSCPGNSNSTWMTGACAGYSLQSQYLLTIAGPYVPVRDEVQKYCNWSAVTLASTIDTGCNLTMSCQTALTEMYSYFTAIDYYNVFGACNNPNFTSSLSTSCIQQGNPVLKSQNSFHSYARSSELYGKLKLATLSASGSADDDTGDVFESSYWASLGAPAFCLSEGPQISEYANNPAFISAVHAKTPSVCWGGCNDVPAFTYNRVVNSTADIYAYLISKIHVLIYDGDFDAVVPYNDNYGWTTTLASELGFPIQKAWSAWQYTSSENNSTQVGGFHMKWDTSAMGSGGFEFRTVRGAGHTVPQDTPDKAFQVFAHFIGNGNGHYYYPPAAASVASSNSDASKLRRTKLVVLILAVLLALAVAIGTVFCFMLFGRYTAGGSNALPPKGLELRASNPMQQA